MNYDLAIATCTFFNPYIHVDNNSYRRGLFLQLVESINKTRWGGIKPVWVIYDDCSTEPVIPETDIPVVFYKQPIGPSKSASKNVIDCLNRAVTLAPYTITIDSDCVVHPDWVKRCFELIEDYPNAPCWGLFNTRHHPVISYNEIESDDPRAVLKHTNTILGTLFRSKDRGQVPDNAWCENFICDIPYQVARIIPVCRPSMIQHCGKHGLNSVDGVTDDFDPEYVQGT